MAMLEESGVLVEMKIPTTTELVSLGVTPGSPIFVLGRNGTGKSALVNELARQWGDRVVYMPGSRPSYFDSESLSLTPSSRRSLASNLRGWDASPDTRWRAISGTQRNEKAIHDLQAAETQYTIDAANEIKTNGSQSSAIARLQSHKSPIDRVNALLNQANLPIQMLIAGGELRASQAEAVYSYARMSDGERAALVFAAEVVAAEAGRVFLIDEPELHLHPSIVVPLLSALIAERPDCGFVICTHQLDLPASSSPGATVLVRGSVWQNSSIVAWDIDVLQEPEQIPEWLRIDILGARRKILFIEGTEKNSLDQPLYSLLFPSVSVRSRQSCRDVVRAVEGIRALEPIHHAKAFGLVDHDGMSTEHVNDLEARGIYALPFFAVESIYYSKEALLAVAAKQSSTLGIPSEQLVKEAEAAALVALRANGSIEHLASRVAERQLRDRLLEAIPTRESLIAGTSGDVQIALASPYPQELARITQLLSETDIHQIIGRYPVRESGALTALAKGLHFASRTDYEKAVLWQVGLDKTLRETLKQKLGALTKCLE